MRLAKTHIDIIGQELKHHSMAQTIQDLENRITDLERELSEREKDLAHYRVELMKANKKLESLIGELSRDLKTATQIQKLLVPTEFPNIPGFEFSTKFVPSSLAGGDYLDIFDQREKLRFGILVSSASGYGLSALLLSALLKLSFSQNGKRKQTVATIVEQIATELMAEMSSKDRCELFYALVDRKSFEMEFAMLGDMHAFHQTYSAQELSALPRTGDGISKANSTRQTSLWSLNSRDRLVICSKGVSETKNLDGEPFGTERLIAAIMSGPKSGVHELRNHMLFELQKFSAGRQAERDVTIVVMEVKDRVIKLAKR